MRWRKPADLAVELVDHDGVFEGLVRRTPARETRSHLRQLWRHRLRPSNARRRRQVNHALSSRRPSVRQISIHQSFHLAVRQSFYLSLCQSARPSVRQSVRPTIHPSPLVCPSIAMLFLPICMSVFLKIEASVCPSVCSPVVLPVPPPSVNFSVCLTICYSPILYVSIRRNISSHSFCPFDSF